MSVSSLGDYGASFILSGNAKHQKRNDFSASRKRGLCVAKPCPLLRVPCVVRKRKPSVSRERDQRQSRSALLYRVFPMDKTVQTTSVASEKLKVHISAMSMVRNTVRLVPVSTPNQNAHTSLVKQTPMSNKVDQLCCLGSFPKTRQSEQRRWHQRS